MTYWPWYVGAIALALVATLHWFAVGRLMSVSSRFTGIVAWMRGLAPSRDGAASEPVAKHFAFFGGVALGGLVATLVAGGFELSLSPGVRFTELFGDSPVVGAIVVGTGGVLVGAGTRMAKGCTSGHGLCGVARFERGSLLATCAFFGTGVVVSMLASAVLG